ncbi:uncharacterized protein LOC129919316 [Episyrphus balteatus]|uniref:uncharacterized protein LOC129919316 n=1 Tax=Episyrphus balteatus TaxID=286459 RepID=UPI0024858AFF|nr:uncharacterized protein LOC129919316 [Episyrphus balteatus]
MKIGVGNFPLIILYVLTTLICGYLGARNFKIQLTDTKCTHKPKYASSVSCSLSEPAPSTGTSYYLQMKRQVKDFRMDVMMFVERSKKFFLLFKAADIDVCKEFHSNVTIMYLQLIKNITLDAGSWPHCPVPENYFYKFENMTPNAEYLPSYLPQVGFKFVIDLKDKKEVFMDLSIFGKIVYNKKRRIAS